jgi:hypothetical protein
MSEGFRYMVTRRAEGPPIPADEPCFVVRGQDAFAMRAIQAYIELTLDVVSPEFTGQLIQHRERIRLWQASHPPKLPD